MRLPGCMCADCAARDLYLRIRVLLPGRQHCDTRSTPRSHLTPKLRDVFLHPGCSESNATVRTKPLIRGRRDITESSLCFPGVMFFAVRSGSFFFFPPPPVLHSSEITVRHRGDRGRDATCRPTMQRRSQRQRQRSQQSCARTRTHTRWIGKASLGTVTSTARHAKLCCRASLPMRH